MNLKIPAKRIFGDNFDPGICMHKTYTAVNYVLVWRKYFVTTARPCFLGDFVSFI